MMFLNKLTFIWVITWVLSCVDSFSQNKKQVFNTFAKYTLNHILDECPNSLVSLKMELLLNYCYPSVVYIINVCTQLRHHFL